MRSMPQIVDVMTPLPISIEASESLAAAVRTMYSQNIRHLPVTQGGHVVGVLSDRDAKLAGAVAKGRFEYEHLLVSDVYVTEPYLVQYNQRLDTVVEHMWKSHIGSAVVLRQEKLVGIFTVTDVCREMVETLKTLYPDA